MSDTVTNLKHGVLAFNGWHFDDAESRVDALVAAVRAEERARIGKMVKKMPDVMMGDGHVIEGTLDRDEVLAALIGADK